MFALLFLEKIVLRQKNGKVFAYLKIICGKSLVYEGKQNIKYIFLKGNFSWR